MQSLWLKRQEANIELDITPENSLWKLCILENIIFAQQVYRHSLFSEDVKSVGANLFGLNLWIHDS